MKYFRDLATPCLILDLDRFENNLQKMSRFAAEHGVALRPHAKTHKCPQVAKRQIGQGAIGICVATIAEAEVMARNGIRGLLITAELVGSSKISRFVELLKSAPDTMLVVDDVNNVNQLQEATRQAGVRADLLLDLDVGQNRTGCYSPPQAVEIAKGIERSPNLHLAGICAYAGHVAHISPFDKRKEASLEALQKAISIRIFLRASGHDVKILSCGSTGTYNIDCDISGVTEIQAGSYVFMDVEYRGIGGKSGASYDDFIPALFVLSTVIHRSGNKAIVDAGLKGFATDRAFGPAPVGFPDVSYEFAGDEHGRLVIAGSVGEQIRAGDMIPFIVPHCDPTVNLYDRIHCIRGEEVVEVWSIMDRQGGYF